MAEPVEPIRHKMTEAVEGPAAGADATAPHDYAPGATAEEVREADQASQPKNEQSRDREDHLINVGRGDQTAGRQ